MRKGFLVFIITLALITAAIGASALAEEAAQDAPQHNYILVIDNSRSTTGRHSLGGATDPTGMRFDAAKLVYRNVLSYAEQGGDGKLGVIVFCGPKNCVRYGPLNIHDETLDEVIGSKLNAEANENYRDDYTDIETALTAARDMMADFSGSTSVILLTDGVNDLSNLSNPFGRRENIEANERSVEIVNAMREEDVDFYVVALTSGRGRRRRAPSAREVRGIRRGRRGRA